MQNTVKGSKHLFTLRSVCWALGGAEGLTQRNLESVGGSCTPIPRRARSHAHTHTCAPPSLAHPVLEAPGRPASPASGDPPPLPWAAPNADREPVLRLHLLLSSLRQTEAGTVVRREDLVRCIPSNREEATRPPKNENQSPETAGPCHPLTHGGARCLRGMESRLRPRFPGPRTRPSYVPRHTHGPPAVLLTPQSLLPERLVYVKMFIFAIHCFFIRVFCFGSGF